MKISVIIAQYLYEQGQLELPGLGTFKIDKSLNASGDVGSSKDSENKNIIFIQKKTVKLSEELIDYIKEKTGKLRPLAEADVYSYLDDVISYLNLGKSYHLDGIGTLHNYSDGELHFTIGTPISEKIESKSLVIAEEKISEEISSTPIQIPTKPILLGIAIILGLAATWWLVGLMMDRKNNNQASKEIVDIPIVEVIDTAAIRRDSIALVIAKEKEGKYKFVFEETNKKGRALRRFAQVNELSPKIQMETSDSIIYKIYVVLPSSGSDTTKIKDSLNAWYYGTLPNKIRVEKP